MNISLPISLLIFALLAFVDATPPASEQALNTYVSLSIAIIVLNRHCSNFYIPNDLARINSEKCNSFLSSFLQLQASANGTLFAQDEDDTLSTDDEEFEDALDSFDNATPLTADTTSWRSIFRYPLQWITNKASPQTRNGASSRTLDEADGKSAAEDANDLNLAPLDNHNQSANLKEADNASIEELFDVVNASIAKLEREKMPISPSVLLYFVASLLRSLKSKLISVTPVSTVAGSWSKMKQYTEAIISSRSPKSLLEGVEQDVPELPSSLKNVSVPQSDPTPTVESDVPTSLPRSRLRTLSLVVAVLLLIGLLVALAFHIFSRRRRALENRPSEHHDLNMEGDSVVRISLTERSILHTIDA